MFKIPLPVLILQHPKEPSRVDAEVSSAALIRDHVAPSFIKTGLSWRNLGHALKGWEGIENVEELQKPALWHTLYLGTKQDSRSGGSAEPGIYYLNRKGEPVDPPENPEIGGLILLDGTWAQAKTLWWRNGWLTKTKRIHIVPKSKSLYGGIRKEPRPECVSTVEALAETLDFLNLDASIGTHLRTEFRKALDQFKKKRS
jgi:hypothetical protein